MNNNMNKSEEFRHMYDAIIAYRNKVATYHYDLCTETLECDKAEFAVYEFRIREVMNLLIDLTAKTDMLIISSKRWEE